MEQLTQLAREAVESLAEGMGVAADFLWPILGGQTFLEGIIAAIFAVVGIVLIFVGGRYLPTWISRLMFLGGRRYEKKVVYAKFNSEKHNEKQRRYGHYPTWGDWALIEEETQESFDRRMAEGSQEFGATLFRTIAVGLLTLVLGINAIYSISPAVKKTINPEYYAVERVMTLVKGQVPSPTE